MKDKALHRFVSFAFSAADILIETDLHGRMCFVAGATSAFGQSAETLVGAALTDLFSPTSRRLVSTMIETGREDRRIGPCRVNLGGRYAHLSAWRIQNSDRVRWTLLFDSADRPECLEGSDFGAAVVKLIEDQAQKGRSVDLGLLWFDGADDAFRQLGAQRADGFFSELREVVRLHSKGGLATKVGRSTYGLVCADDTALQRLEALVTELSSAEGLEGVSPRTHAMTADPKKGIDDQIEAFLDSAAHLDATGEAPVGALLSELADRLQPANEARAKALSLSIKGRLIEPYAQPIVDADSGSTVGYELLARLPGGSSIAAAVQFAERHGVVDELDLAMVDTAVDFLRESANRPPLHVNLSGASVSDPDFAADLLTRLEDIRIDRARLGFEITETARIVNRSAAADLIAKLRSRRHPVALDDFGSGQAGFEYLRAFEVDRIKIDGGLVPKQSPSERDRAVIRGISALAHELGASVTAESVEEKWQAAMLSGCGVDHLQGWLYGQAEPLGEIMGRYKPDLSGDEPAVAFG